MSTPPVAPPLALLVGLLWPFVPVDRPEERAVDTDTGGAEEAATEEDDGEETLVEDEGKSDARVEAGRPEVPWA